MLPIRSDLAVAHVPEGAVDVAHGGDPHADVLDDSGGEAEVDDIADADLVFGDDEDAVEHVLHDVLRAEAEAGADRRREQGQRAQRGRGEQVDDQQQRDDDDRDVDDVLQDRAQRARALHESDRRERGALQRLGVIDVRLVLRAVDDASHDPADHELQDPAQQERADDDSRHASADSRRSRRERRQCSSQRSDSGGTAVFRSGPLIVTILTTDAASHLGRAGILTSRLGGVALLHGERALDAGEVLVDEAAQRGRGVGVRCEPRARRVAQLEVGQRRGVQADDDVLRDLVASASPRSAAACRSTASRTRRAGRRSAGCWNPSAVERTIVFGQVVRVDDRGPRGELAPRRSGSTAFACAANSPPFAVLSAARASSICASRRRRRPRRARSSSCQDRSVSTSRPSSVDLAVAQRLHDRPVRRGRGRGREGRHELELAVAAGFRRLRERPEAVGDLRARRVPLLGRDVGVRRELQLGERGAHGRRLGLARRCCAARGRRSRSARTRHPASDPTPRPRRASGRAGRRCRRGARSRSAASGRRGGSSRRRGRRR